MLMITLVSVTPSASASMYVTSTMCLSSPIAFSSVATLDFSMYLRYCGATTTVRTAITAITIISSTRVKPLLILRILLKSFFIHFLLSFLTKFLFNNIKTF